ncbi:hypothetical protein ACROYT_G028499 [Oculina patagonica]
MSSASRLAKVEEKDIPQIINDSIPKNTKKKTTWSVFIFKEGVLKLTLEPSDPSYAKKGRDAKLVWDYSVDNKQAELSGIIYSVQVSGGAFKEMLVQQNDGSVVNHPNIPAAYKGRVKVEGNATLVIVNVTSQDNTRFRCTLVPTSGLDISSEVQLIVTEAPQVSPPLVQATYIEGSSVNISCTASGTPDPDVKWIRNSEVKSSGKKTAFLAFNGINRTDDGQYTCRASNQAGNDEKHVILVVNYTSLRQTAVGATPEGVPLRES